MILVWLLTLLAGLATSSAPAPSVENPWAEPTRGILAQHCGRCHLPNLPTSVPRALNVFNLTEDPWYGRLTHEQLDSLLHRMDATKEVPKADAAIVERFVVCARDRVCASASP